ncbi:hypothetical protein EDB87DRAFT_1647582 [Lactarius vividus]|nr:hypothetical protein EDB87DRAFT_1647582 [Lactarius vividus]
MLPTSLPTRAPAGGGYATAWMTVASLAFIAASFNGCWPWINVFVFGQIFNSFNCRRLDQMLNVFEGLWRD